ncbi:MAG: terminase small subunit [Nitrososphaerales archaeon]
MPKEKKERVRRPCKNKDGLTVKQEAFCREYLIDLNGAQACIRAGYSEKTARQIATEMLSKLHIQDYMSSLMQKREKRTEVTSDRVVKELAKLAFFNMEDVIDEKGVTKELTEWSRDDLAAIQEVTEDKLGGEEGTAITRRKVKVSDKKASLELLARHLGIFNDKVQHSGNIGLTDLTSDELDRKLQQLEREHEQSTKA